MQKCSNPNCNYVNLHEDRSKCPFCQCSLVACEDPSNQNLMPADAIPVLDLNTSPIDQGEEQSALNNFDYNGSIVEINHQELFQSKTLKLINAIFRDEPYQLEHQTSEYAIRLETRTDNLPGEVKDFFLYGSYMGHLQVGDNVCIQAKYSRHRYIVKSLYNRTTNQVIKPGFQIPAILIQTGAFIIFLFLLFIAYTTLSFIQSGAALALITSIIAGLIPIGIVIWLVLYVIRGCFFGGRRK